MSLVKVAGGAATAVILVIGGTFLFTQFMAPKNKFEACIPGSVAGAAIGGPFELTDHTGLAVTDLDVLDKPSLVYFGYTFCPDVCPMDVARNAVAVDILAETGRKARPVFITIDPERDTAEELADFVANNHPDMVGLTGTAAQVARAARGYKVYYQRQPGEDEEYYLMAHSNFTYLMMPEHGFVDFFRGDLDPGQVAELVACVIDAA